MKDKPLPMGKVIKCHHGTFNLPSEIYELEIDDDYIRFMCSDGIYEANHENKWKIIKLRDNLDE